MTATLTAGDRVTVTGLRAAPQGQRVEITEVLSDGIIGLLVMADDSLCGEVWIPNELIVR